MNISALAASLVCVVSATTPEMRSSAEPVTVFEKLNGHWKGTFTGYAVDGTTLYRIAVEQRYWRESDTVQRVEIKDTLSDGTVVTGRGANIATPQADGGLVLQCRVEKSNGDKVVHRGVHKEEDGQELLFWYSDMPQRREVFRERVYRHGGRSYYEIVGSGLYNGTLILMHGTYTRIGDAKGPRAPKALNSKD